MSVDELVEQMQLVTLDGPALILVNMNEINMDAFNNLCIPNLQHQVIVLGVDGKPDVLKLTVKQLEDALEALKGR